MQSEINPERDVTVFYLNQILAGKAPALGKIAGAFEEICIDRVIQTFVDAQILTGKDAIENPLFLAGQVDMAMKFKKLLSNLNNLSSAVAEGDIAPEEITAETIISAKDLQLANKISKGEK